MVTNKSNKEKTDEKKDGRGGRRWEMEDITAKDLAAFADQVDLIAQNIRTLAADLAQLDKTAEVPGIRIATGNFRYGLDKLQNWMGKQLWAKMAAKAVTAGRTVTLSRAR